MEKKFEFKKLSESKFAFVMKSEDIERTEIVSKQFAKDHYKDLVRQKIEMMNNLNQSKKELETNRVPYDKELENFIELANKAHKYNLFMKAEQNHKSVLKMIEEINVSMTNMEKVFPEVRRGQK